MFFNLQQYCERVLMHLPKDFGGPVFIEFLYSGSLLSLEEMSDYCIAFIAAVAELRNRYGHSIIILGPYPKRTLDQTKFEFESSRKELFDLTNILTMIALHANIPVLPLIGTLFAAEKAPNTYYFSTDSITKEQKLYNYSGSVTREFIHRLSYLIETCFRITGKAILNSSFRKTYESIQRSPLRNKYFPIIKTF